MTTGAIDPAALNRLKWRSRRGLLENDLFIQRFFRRHGDALTPRLAAAFESLMALDDPTLLDLLLGREAQESSGRLGSLSRDMRDVLALMRTEEPR
jgi:antitoxin CptB